MVEVQDSIKQRRIVCNSYELVDGRRMIVRPKKKKKNKKPLHCPQSLHAMANYKCQEVKTM